MIQQYIASLSKYTCPGIARHLQLGDTIWLNPSKKLLSYKQYWFMPWDKLPLKVRREFEHHSHTHSSVVVTSGSTNHNHVNRTTGTITCAAGSSPHSHSMFPYFADSHTHDFTVAFAAADLGSPWWNHTHVCSASAVTNGGAAHVHVTTCLGGFCSYTGCDGAEHTHTSGNTGSAGGAHSDHSITFSTTTAVGTDVNHTHTFSGTSGSGGSHSGHTWPTPTNYNTCFRTINHRHTVTGSSGANVHTHLVAGTSGAGGEASPTASLKRLLIGVGL